MRIAAILYDYDHTLVHTPIDFAAMRRGVYDAIETFGVPVADREQKLILEVLAEAAAQLPDGRAEDLRRQAEAHIRGLEHAAARQAAAIEGVPESLRRLRAEGRKVAVITRNCREVVELCLERAPMEFDLLLTRDDVAEVKPAPGHALEALGRLGVAADEAILVGDFRGDIECARQAGIVAVGVTTGSASADDLRRAGADHVLASAAEIPDWLRANGW